MKSLLESKLSQRRFSRAAKHYDGRASLQAAIARELILKLNILKNAFILDVGAGDGTVASELTDQGMDVVALDAAWGMVERGYGKCARARWVQADACALPFAPGKFDQVVSSSAYQWVDDLPRAFMEVRRVLKPGGRFSGAMFGRSTLKEFFTSLECGARDAGRALPAIKRLASVQEVRHALQKADFKDVAVSSGEKQTGFKDVRAILTWLQGVGANALAEKFFWGKGLLAATEKEYRRGFSQDEDLSVTFEVIWIEAEA